LLKLLDYCSGFVSFLPWLAGDVSKSAFWLKNRVAWESKMAKIVMTETYLVEYNIFNRVFEPSPLSLANPFGTGNNDLGYQDFGRVLRANASTEFSYRSVALQSPYDTDNVRIDFSGTGFEYATTIQDNGLGPATIYGAPNKGTVNAVNISIVDRTSHQPGLTTETISVAITDIAISLPDLDPRNYKTMIARLTTGDDQIFGSSIADIINAGAGNDMVYAFDGNDTVYGGTGNDFLNGESGDDNIFGEEGNDLLTGGAGNDFIFGGGGNDYIYGNEGDDRLYGEDGNDVLLGSSGNDLIFGGDGRDQLLGDDGNDWLVGGGGNDFMFGGKGDDGFVYDPEDRSDSVGNPNNAYFGGEGFDTLFIDWALVGDQFVVGLNGINLSRREIEQAIMTRNDTEGLPWAQIITVYDQEWRVSKYEFVQDDGSRSIWYQDADHTRPWTEIREYYTPAGKLDYEQIYNDDGSNTFLDFDLANTASWFSRILKTNAAGAIISDTYVYDTAMEQRSAEMGSTAVKVKAIPLDILI
jgi:RTX calcium-binding nonapeptide repeat (4 copies)